MTTYDERIVTYFGDAVLRAGFMPVPHLLMRHYRALDLSAEHAMFALQLMEISWDLAQPPVTMRKIADRMGTSVRTAQRYSEYLAARGLIVIYEQFQDGAQVENGYDLSPLFRALARFAPEPRPGGTPRERRRRNGVAGPPVTDVAPPDDSHDTLPHDTRVTPRDDRGVAPARDRADTPAPTRASWLKGKQELPKNHQKQIGGAARQPAPESDAAPANKTAAGRSLRLENELDAAEVARSRRLLDTIGLHAPVARACAPTLAPAEVLALGAYARAAGLGTGWIAGQIFNFDRRAPRTADLARRWDATGERLATLDDATAGRLLELVDRHAPDAPGAVVADACYAAGDDDAHGAAAALWALMHDVRGGAAATRELLPPDLPAVERAGNEVWHAVLERLRGEVGGADFETWLRPARLLVLDNDVAVVATDNVFAREQLEQVHSEALERAFSAELGRTTRIDVVIG